MQIELSGTRLWFDVDGAAEVLDGSGLRQRPTVLLIHGGPASYDHSYFRPEFSALTSIAQVVYIDLRDHGRSARHEPSRWSFELCADDVHDFCRALGIVRPVVYGHSMGGIIAMLYGARHPAHPAALILQSTMARFDLARLVEGFRRIAGDEVAALAERDYSGTAVSPIEWDRVFAAFGPRVPDAAALARRIRNAELAEHGMNCLRQCDVAAELARIRCPTLVCVGELDPVTPVAAAEEIAAALPAECAQLEILERAGHFPWLDDPGSYWKLIRGFVRRTTSTEV